METGVICPYGKLLLPAYVQQSGKTLGPLCSAKIDKLGASGSQWVNNACYLWPSSNFGSSLKMHTR